VNLDMSYVPTARERRSAAMYPWFAWLLYAGVAGGVVAVAGAGALSRAAARHGEATGAASLAAVGGALSSPFRVAQRTLLLRGASEARRAAGEGGRAGRLPPLDGRPASR